MRQKWEHPGKVLDMMMMMMMMMVMMMMMTGSWEVESRPQCFSSSVPLMPHSMESNVRSLYPSIDEMVMKMNPNLKKLIYNELTDETNR